MHIIRTTQALRDYCEAARQQDFVCIDTEFMRESTFFSILCLVQMATPAKDGQSDAILDPLAEGIDLTPLKDLLMDDNVTKVMHAARQDMEIFYNICEAVPTPVFDTQIAAMALGFGDSAGYGALVKGRLDISLDKGARFTDWSRRPLSDKQLTYALADVTHLRDLFPGLVADLKEQGRYDWIISEMDQHADEALYTFEPEEAWRRLKLRGQKKQYLAALKGVAAWRERQAIKKDIPRRRILKDDALYDLAQQRPRDLEALGRLRGIPRGFEKSSGAKDLIECLSAAIDNADDYAPPAPKAQHMPPDLGPRIEMLKTLLRLKTEVQGIATRLVANARDIEQLAAFGERADIAALTGWRREIFGQEALDMLRGKIALRLDGEMVVAERLD